MVFLHRVTIKPYLKTYLSYYVTVEPYLVLSDTNRFGSFLLNSLKHKKQIKKSDLKIRLEGVDLVVSISEWYERNYGVIISYEHQGRFNNFLFDDFTDRMLDFVLPKLTGKKGEIRKELLKFREKYSISEDELGFTTMKKQFERANMCLMRYKSA